MDTNQKIEISHPKGKKGIKMDFSKYHFLRSSIINCLKEKGKATQSELLDFSTKYLKDNNLTFDGSIGWHLEWVKLDMESKSELNRCTGSSPLKYELKG